MSPVRFEPTISAGEQPQTYALDRAATGTGIIIIIIIIITEYNEVGGAFGTYWYVEMVLVRKSEGESLLVKPKHRW